MFSNLFQATKAIFARPPALVYLSSHSTVDEQLQIELANAVEKGMVTSRRQEHLLSDDESLRAIQNGTAKVQSRKRKTEHDMDITPKQSSPKRRRRDMSTAIFGPGSPTVVESPEKPLSANKEYKLKPQAMGDQTNNAQNLTGEVIAGEVDRTVVTSTPSTNVAVQGSSTANGDSIVDAVGSTLDSYQPPGKASDGTQQVNFVRQKKISSVRDFKRREKFGFEEPVTASRGVPASTISKATHKRFGSDDIELSDPLSFEVKADIDQSKREGYLREAVIEDNSEDDAPDTVTASNGLDQARMAVKEVSNAIERQETAGKKRRRDLDARLKLQAKSAKKHRTKLSEFSLETVEKPMNSDFSDRIAGDSERIDESPLLSGEDPLPALLPDDILAIEPPMRSPTPLLTIPNGKKAMNLKRKFFDADPKPPKDITRGPVKVRVLELDKTNLPPRASKSSRMLKESWLTGHRGGVGVQRRKFGGGFVRK